YYSYNLGDWHIIALNGELDVTPASTEVQWLRNDLALYSGRCTLAYWHAPRFVSGVNITSNPKYQTLWDTLYAYGSDVVINGHKHSYERLAPQTPAAVRDTVYGIRSFIVGTGGTGLDGGSPPPVANSEVRDTHTWGVLKLTLNTGSYSWQFVPVAGQTFADAGSGLCHDAPSATNHAPTAAAGGPYAGAEGATVSFDGSASADSDGDGHRRPGPRERAGDHQRHDHERHARRDRRCPDRERRNELHVQRHVLGRRGERWPLVVHDRLGRRLATDY